LINVAGGIPALLNKKVSISLMIVNEARKKRYRGYICKNSLFITEKTFTHQPI